METKIEPNKDPSIIAALNKTVQNIHSTAYPQLFKPYDYNSVFTFMKDTLAQDNWFSYIAICNDQTVGYALFYIKEYKENPFRKAYKAIHIDQICINPDFQRKNIGSSFMKSIEAFAKNHDIHKIELTFWEKNIHAKQFYEKYGFKRMMNFASKEI